MTTLEIIELAKKHANNGAEMSTSARLCLKDAIELAERDDKYARMRAITSLSYSVGISHPDYQKANAK